MEINKNLEDKEKINKNLEVIAMQYAALKQQMKGSLDFSDMMSQSQYSKLLDYQKEQLLNHSFKWLFRISYFFGGVAILFLLGFGAFARVECIVSWLALCLVSWLLFVELFVWFVRVV